MHKNGNIGIKGLRMGLVKNEFNQYVGLNTFLSELSCQMLVEGYLTWLFSAAIDFWT